MGVDPDLEALMETVGHRIEFVELLGDEALQPRDIVDALDYSRPTVHRALRELREADLVEKREDGYTATLPGLMAANQYRRYETASQAILSSRTLLAAVPDTHAPAVELLTDADVILVEAEMPVRALEVVADRVQRAETVRAFLPTLINTRLLWVWHRAVLTTSVTGEAIFAPDLLTVLKGQYPHLLAEMAAADGFAAFSTTGPPYGVVLTKTGDTTSVTVIVYEDDTAVRGVLTNDTGAAVEWARTELDRLRSEASEVTADLDALSAAVTDGLAQRFPSVSTSPPPQLAGDGPAQATAGHTLPIDLDAEGFVRLSEEYFDVHNRASPDVSWRTGFTLAEVQAGHAVDHLDADGRNLTHHLVENLTAGADHVVLGSPGSGKSTVCMAVACEWYDRGLGPVLYRELGDGDSFESAALLEAYLRQTDGHALVVVEDAIRDVANAVFTVMQTFEDDESVSFLLDARTHEWRNVEAAELDARLDAYRRSRVEQITIPGLDERDCERFVDHFSDLVDDDLDLSGAELFTMVEEGRAVDREGSIPGGDALVVQHYLIRRYDPTIDEHASTATALDDAVRRTYRTLTEAKARLAPDLAVLVAVLTAASVPVADEYCYAIVSANEYTAVDEAIPLLDGRLLFDQGRPRAGGPTTYRTRHETWALRFLEQVHDLEPTHRARERVSRCVTQLLALADDPDQREQIQRHLGGRTPHLYQIEADPEAWADELVERVFRIGRTNAGLAPLFGETTDDMIELPAACSAWTRLQQAYWRGEMNRTHGDLARAEREFRTLGDLALKVELPAEPAVMPPTPAFTSSHADGTDDLTAHRTRWRAASRTNLGLVARDRGEYEAAEEYHQEALALCREIADRGGEATCLKHLGFAAYFRSEYDQAREYLQRGLAIAEEIDARTIEAASLNQLGLVATEQGAYDEAREYQERSLVIARDLRDRYWEAASLGGLGEIAEEQGAYDEAREYGERGLALARDLGARYGEATILNNLGIVARKQGAYNEALEYHERSLAINRDLGAKHGEAISHKNLGIAARLEGDPDRARDHLNQALTALDATEDRGGWGKVRFEQGRLALAERDVDRARERARQARETFEELGMTHWVGRSRLLLGRVAAATDAPDEAREHWRVALETFETVGAPQDTLDTLEKLVETCLGEGDEDQAREWCQRAREGVADAPDSTAAQQRDWIERATSELEGT